MRVLIIGADARSHAFLWSLSHSPQISFLACLPGNSGSAQIANNIPLDPLDFDSCIPWAKEYQIDLTIVGPANPLAKGIVDAFAAAGLHCLGPTSVAARLESSKVWSKSFMQRHGIPTSNASIVNKDNLYHVISSLFAPDMCYPVAVKADGLVANGRGVVIAYNANEAQNALEEMILQRKWEYPGDQVLLETFLYGREVSVFAICDGKHYRLLNTACDYKRAYDHDEGPNTGGMGAYSPASWLDENQLREIEKKIIDPIVVGMRQDGTPFFGFLYIGIMITDEGPKVIEINCRFGDPEATVILPLLETPFLELCQAALAEELDQMAPLSWKSGSACAVVIAAKDYPVGHDVKELPICGINNIDDDILIFHTRTIYTAEGVLAANGGRVMTIVGLGDTLAQARQRAYTNVRRVQFDGARYRSDIGAPSMRV